MMFKKIVAILFYELVLMGSSSASDTLPINQPIEITGKIIGPIQSGGSKDEGGMRAYYLKLSKPMLFNENEIGCGEQKLDKLAIIDANIKKYKNKKVKITAEIQCIINRLGKFGLVEIKSISLIK